MSAYNKSRNTIDASSTQERPLSAQLLSKYHSTIWSKTYKYLQVAGYLNFKLTGKFTDSIASQIGHLPFNYKKFKWSSSGDINYKIFPIEKEKLPDIVKPGEIIGEITKKAGTETGLPANIPVIACGSDKGCETIGMGVINNEMASLSFGTTATVQTTTEKYFEPLKFMPPWPAPIPGHYNPEVEIFRGYWMITWFKREFGHEEIIKAKKKKVVPEEILNELLKQVPAGSMGLIVQPYWGPGLKEPSAKGSIIGFGAIHTKAHIYKAVIEGLAYALLEGMRKIEKSGGFKIKKVAVSGGASQSDEICQITSDIFNLPIVKGRTYETGGLGAAIITAVGIGEYNSFDKAIKKMVRYRKTFLPNAQNSKIYQKFYKDVYLKMYRSLKNLYKDIRKITNYPEKID